LLGRNSQWLSHPSSQHQTLLLPCRKRFHPAAVLLAAASSLSNLLLPPQITKLTSPLSSDLLTPSHLKPRCGKFSPIPLALLPDRHSSTFSLSFLSTSPDLAHRIHMHRFLFYFFVFFSVFVAGIPEVESNSGRSPS